MGVYRFEDLRVWQAAQRQADLVGGLINGPEFERDDQLRAQMNDAVLSVSFNIVEGFQRRRDRETLQFLRYSFASNGELKAAYYVASGRRYIGETELSELIGLNESIAKMLRRWMATLADGGPRTKGQGHARNQGRTKDQARTKDDERRTKDQL